jgi:DNA-binding transcriptional MerR regulator
VLRIGDVAEATGLTQRAIRYYEELGLLTPADRATGANRRYSESDIERLRLIKRLREDIGLRLAEVRRYLELEDMRRELKSEYVSTDDRSEQLALLDRVEPIIRQRMAMLEHKLELVSALHAEDQSSLERIARLRAQQQQQEQAPQPRDEPRQPDQPHERHEPRQPDQPHERHEQQERLQPWQHVRSVLNNAND